MTTILIFGTYDGIHEGHRDFFAQARSLGEKPHLIVSVARDENVLKVKGKLPYENEALRTEALRREPLVDEVVLGALGENYIDHIVALEPDIIALGYDQDGTVYTDTLSEKLTQAHCKAQIVRCKPFKPDIYKSSKLKR